MGAGGVLCACVWSVWLVLFDVTEHRLPDALTLPAAAAALAFATLRPAALWGLVWPAGYLFFGRSIGGGDIKLAVPLGIAVCWFAGPAGVLAAVALSGLATAIFGLVRRSARVPHGPSMIASAWAVAALGYLWA